MKSNEKRVPKLSRHSSGQGRVRLNGHMHYCGRYGTASCAAKYAELIQKWEANGRRPLEPRPDATQLQSVRQLADAYLEWIDGTGRYVKGGVRTSYRRQVGLALDEFVAFIGRNRAGRAALAVAVQSRDVLLHRDELEQRPGLGAATINRKLRMLKTWFGWAAERAYVGTTNAAAIAAIKPLRVSGAERKAKRPVSLEDAQAVAAHCPDTVARMLITQAVTGMRPGEVCAMRWCNLLPGTQDVAGVPCRIYRVAAPKNEHHANAKPTTYALPPAVVELMGTPTSPGDHVFRSRRTGRRLTPHGYGDTIRAACARAGVEPFGPHELRHGFLTRAAKQYGVVAASAAANHSSTAITSRYVHADATDGYRAVVGLAPATLRRVADEG